MSFSVLGGYNEQEYNAPLYNDNDLYVALADAMASSDVDTYLGSLSKTETVALAENLIRYFNGQIFMDAVSAADAVFKEALLTRMESVAVADSAVALSAFKALVESMSASDVRTLFVAVQKTDVTTLVDVLTRQITDKRLNDSVRLNDWFTVKNAPQSDPWS